MNVESKQSVEDGYQQEESWTSPPAATQIPKYNQMYTMQPNMEPQTAPILWNIKLLLLVVVSAIFAGLEGALLMIILEKVQQTAFGYSSGTTYLDGVTEASPARRVIVLLINGLLVGVGGCLLKYVFPGDQSITSTLWLSKPLNFVACVSSAFLSIFCIALGASLGREAAPQLLAAAFCSILADFFSVSASEKRILIAIGGAAAFSAVYNVRFIVSIIS
jgi:H+/Cl- antiporter ClcA